MMLYLATYRWRDGEQEYYSRRFVRTAGNMDEAWELGRSYLTDMWGDETIEEDGYFQPPCGFPVVRLDSMTEVRTLEEAIGAIGCVEDYALNTT